MTSKNTDLRTMIINPLLTDKQTNNLKTWINNKENRTISILEISRKIGISKKSLYNALHKNPERPFDELKLSAVNNLIKVFNDDIKAVKELKKKEKIEADENSKKLAEQLIKKVAK